ALDKGILDRVPRPNEMQLHTPQVRPGIEGAALEFRAVVDNDLRWEPPGRPQTVEHLRDAMPAHAHADFDGHAFPRALIHYRQRPKGAAIAQRVLHEIHRPA